MTIEAMTQRSGEWLKGSGPESDIVMSCRIRLARNMADYPFIRRCTDIDRVNIEATVREQLTKDERFSRMSFIHVGNLEDVDRQFLVERQIISRELAKSEGARSVAVDENEQLSLMVNEEDHFRIQVIMSGLDLAAAYEKINELDDLIESHITYAFHPLYGYLTSCPTNVGTGMRVSVMLHLPALVITQQIEKVFRSLQRISLVVRGLHGEGTQAMGDFYQISNQITLGKTENDLLNQVSEVIPVIIEYERKAREYLVAERQNELFDKVSRAYGTLQTAQQISSEETMYLLSQVRMGVNLGLIGDLAISQVNELFIHTQPAHLQKLCKAHLSTNQRNIERANYLHSQLKPSGNETN